MIWIDPKTLPPDDLFRNTSLWSLAAEYRPRLETDEKKWNVVTKKFKIGEKTFNELGETWLLCQWRIPA